MPSTQQPKTAETRRFQLDDQTVAWQLPDSSDDLNLDTAAEQLNTLLTRGRLLARKTAETYRDAGILLSQIKRRVGHGKFTPWVKEHTDLSPRRARELMVLARRWGEIEEWAEMAGFDLNGAAFEKVMQAFKFKDKPEMRPDEDQQHRLKLNSPVMVLKSHHAAADSPSAWEQAKGRELAPGWVETTSPPAVTQELEVARVSGYGLEAIDKRLRQALSYLAMAEIFSGNYAGHSYLSEAGQERLAAVMDEIEERLPETRLLREQGKQHPYRPSNEGLF